MKRAALLLLAAVLLSSCAHRTATPEQADLLIQNARIVDGTGAKSFLADVAIRGEQISHIGKIPPGTVNAKRVIQANGRVLSPGFVDTHAHGDPEKDDFSTYVAMGVTTIALGQDGTSAFAEGAFDKASPPDRLLPAWIERLNAGGVQLNVAPVSGHGSIRRLAGISDSVRSLNAEQQARMDALLAADLAAGSFGLSTGLEYVPGRYSETAELRSLAKLVAKVDGIVFSHMRTEDDGLIEGAIQELIDYGSGARIQVSHLKVVFGKGQQTAHRLLAFIARKRSEGARLSADIYPYDAGYTGIGIIFPEWALPPSDYAAVVRNRRQELLDYLRARMTRRGGPTALLLGSAPFAGKTLADVARDQDKPFEDVLLALGPQGGHGAHFIMDAALQDVLLLSPLTAISTDGAPGARHPRATGTYAKLIEHYVVNQHSLSLEEAVRKSSGLPASVLGLVDRGIIREGARADILLFDPSKVRARSDYLHPHLPAEGFDLVIINGEIVREDGVPVPGRFGRVLRRGT